MPAKDLVFTVLGVDRASQTFNKVGDSLDRLGNRASKVLAGVAASSAAASVGVAAAVAAPTAAFIGLGAVALRENEKVKDSFQALSFEIQGGLAQDAAPLEAAFVGAADNISAAYQRMRPQLADAFEASVPHVETLTDSVTGFAENAMPGLVRSVQRAGPVMEGLQSLMEDTGTATSQFFDIVSQHSPQAGEGLEHFGDLVRGVLPEVAGILGDLATVWADRGGQIVAVVNQLVGIIGDLSGSALPVMSQAIGVAADVLGGLLSAIEPITPILGPMIGAWISLAAAMRGIRGVSGVLSGVVSRVDAFSKSTQRASRRTKLVRAGLIGMVAAAGAALSQMSQLNPQIDAMTEGLDRWSKGGKLAGEAARILGGDLGELQDALGTVTADGFGGFAEGATDFVGNLIGMDSNLDVAKRRIDSLDQALAQMVESGNTEAATDALRAIAEKTGISVEELRKQLPQYAAAMEVAESSSKGAADGIGDVGDEAAQAAERVKELIDTIDEATSTFFSARDSARAYEESLDTANETIAENGRGLDITTEKGRENQAALDELAQSAIVYAEETLKDAQANGTLNQVLPQVLQRLQQQKTDFVNAAVAAGMERDRARELANRLFQIPKNVRTNVATPGMGDALGNLRTYLHRANAIPRHISTTVTTIFTSIGSGPTAANRLLSSTYADGGIVGYADGGQVRRFPHGGQIRGPGGPREDRVPILASNGEFVVNASSTRRFRPVLEAINSDRTAAMAQRAVAGFGFASRPSRPAPVTFDVRFSGTSGSRFVDALLDDLQERIRQQYGGNVVTALGQP